MPDIPVRMELRVGLNGPTCCFIVDHYFFFKPTQHDAVIFTKGEGDPHIAEVHRCLHYDGLKPEILVMTNPYICESYDELLKTLDWFKSRYDIHDLDADKPPEGYYVLYRMVIDLLEMNEDNPTILYEQRAIKIVAETMRTIYIAEWIGDIGEKCKAIQAIQPKTLENNIHAGIGASADETLRLMQAILAMRQAYPTAAPLLEIARFWDNFINNRGTDKKWTWDVPRERCIEVGKYVFKNTEGVPFLA